MNFSSVQKKIRRTPEDLARIKAIREKFQKNKPTQEELLASGEYEGPYALRGMLLTRALLQDLKQAREAAGLSLAEIARRTGIDQAALSRLENGKNVNPTIDTLHRMAAALGQEITFGLSSAEVANGSPTGPNGSSGATDLGPPTVNSGSANRGRARAAKSTPLKVKLPRAKGGNKSRR